jgi:hypothetical protein
VTPNGCFVVKWFFCLRKHDGLFDEDDPVNTVLIKDNNIQIQAELSQLTLGQWFLKAFFKFAQKKGAVVDKSRSFNGTGHNAND